MVGAQSILQLHRIRESVLSAYSLYGRGTELGSLAIPSKYLQEDTPSCLHSILYGLDIAAVLNGELLKPGPFHPPDPVVRLLLRVNQQWPLQAVRGQDGILGRVLTEREPL